MTHGTLENDEGTVKIPGIFNYEESGVLSFTADNTKLGVFYAKAEWTFFPDPRPEPSVTWPRVSRIVIVGDAGKEFEEWDLFKNGVDLYLQDNDQTLKIFPKGV